MFEWSDEQLAIRDAVRQFIDKEIRPHVDELEHGDTPPYDILRKFFATFGMDAMARDRFKRQIEFEKQAAEAIERGETPPERPKREGGSDQSITMLPIIELCRVCPGMVTAMGVSMGLTAAAIQSKGTIAQKERWVPELLTMEKIGAWAITEPNSGSDAFGSMKSTARRDGDEYLLNGSKTFITNGPYADTIVFICKLDEGNPPEERKILSFVLDKGMPGLEQSKPLRKMGMHSSPTGELFLTDVRVGKDRLIGETEDLPSGGREGAKDTFNMERSGVAAMALGIIEECLELSVQYAKDRVQFGKPIGEFQLIQEKLARMEVARLNVQNLVFRTIEMGQAGRGLSAWPTPDILPLDAWLHRLWESALVAGHPLGDRRLLRREESRFLWKQIVQQDAPGPDAGLIGGLASSAWRLCQTWQIPVAQLVAAAETADHRAFAGWAVRYGALLDARRWTDEGRLLAALGDGLPALPGEAIAELRFAGFYPWTPDLETLATRLRAAGTTVSREADESVAPGPPAQVTARDDDDELCRALAWAADRLRTDPGADIAILVPDLERQAGRIRNLGLNLLAPGWQLRENRVPPVSLSGGRTLTDYPVVDSALRLLDFTLAGGGFAEASILLRYPYWAGGCEERAGRARAA
ncbi:MAG: acyl-CoA dehydrogenase family protein, partial [Gammaproteobacteria bacterium]|nr:acyl-CoA dehydrogenase family protein [Gammaproteobacteria bacterium]